MNKIIIFITLFIFHVTVCSAKNPYLDGMSKSELDPPPYPNNGAWVDPEPDMYLYYYANPADNHTPMPRRLREKYPEFFASAEIDGRLKELFPVNFTDWCEDAEEKDARISLLELIIMANEVLDMNKDHCLSAEEMNAGMECVSVYDKTLVLGANAGLTVLHTIGVHTVFGHDTSKKLNAKSVLMDCDWDHDNRVCPYDLLKKRFNCLWKCTDRELVLHILERMFDGRCAVTWNKPFAAKVKEYLKDGAYKPGPTETPVATVQPTPMSTPVRPSFANHKFQHPDGTLKQLEKIDF